jgi:NitT/TauT family transport system substrate-binding protein
MKERVLRNWFAAFAVTLAVALPSLSARALGADKVALALPGNSMGYLPLHVAVHRGFFKDEGIDIEVPRLVPNMAHNALMSGDIQYHGLADSGLRLAARGAPIKAIFYAAARPMYYLVAQRGIRSVAELKGKMIGVSQFGGTSDLSARLVLRHHGVEPEWNVVILQIGSEATRIAALQAGSVGAIIVPVPAVVLLRQQGFNELAFVGDVVEFASNGYSTTEGRIKQRPQEVKKVVRAMYRGLRFAKENPEETTKVIERHWKVEPNVAKESYEAIVRALNDDGIIGEKQLKVHFDIIRRTEKNIGEIPVERVVDFRLLREVRRELSGK